MAAPKHPRHYDEAFKWRIVQSYESGRPSREIGAEHDIARSTPRRRVQETHRRHYARTGHDRRVCVQTVQTARDAAPTTACGGPTTSGSTPPPDTGARRNSSNKDSSSKKLSNTPLPIHKGAMHRAGLSLKHDRPQNNG